LADEEGGTMAIVFLLFDRKVLLQDLCQIVTQLLGGLLFYRVG